MGRWTSHAYDNFVKHAWANDWRPPFQTYVPVIVNTLSGGNQTASMSFGSSGDSSEEKTDTEEVLRRMGMSTNPGTPSERIWLSIADNL